MNALDWIRKIRKPGRRPSVLSVSATMPSGEHAASPTPPACPTPQGAESENNPAVGGPGFDLLTETEWKTAVESHYDRYLGNYRDAYGTIFQAEVGDNPEAFFDWLAEQMELSDGMQLLDAGCGIAGPALELVKRHDLDILGITLGEKVAREARDAVRAAGRASSIRVVDGDFHDMEAIAGGQQFDRVFFLESIGHSYDLPRLLKSVYAVLKPGGLLIAKDWFIKPIDGDPELLARRRELCRTVIEEYHYLTYERRDWMRMLREAGFEVRLARRFQLPGAPVGSREAFDAAVGFQWTSKQLKRGSFHTKAIIVAEKPA
jgi:cyclopropane fatty-acyl-phospholipid synthase-like methyltransferase